MYTKKKNNVKKAKMYERDFCMKISLIFRETKFKFFRRCLFICTYICNEKFQSTDRTQFGVFSTSFGNSATAE